MSAVPIRTPSAQWQELARRRNFAPNPTRLRARFPQDLLPAPAEKLLRIDPIARRGFIPAWEILCEIWDGRACLICEKFGHCRHREPEFDWAELECMQRRMESAGKVSKV